MTAPISKQDWLLLFGGANRESSVFRMLDRGMEISMVIVPEVQSPKLSASIKLLQNSGLDIRGVTKAELQSKLLELPATNILSIGFPYIIPGPVIQHHKLCLNMHPTLLPKYRGPSSGAYIIINGERLSGSTVHLMDLKVDDGDIVAQSEVSLTDFDTIRSLQRKVYESEADLLMRAFEALDQGNRLIRQDPNQSSSYPIKRVPKDSELDANKPLNELFNFIRACDPDEFPAFFFHKGEKVCIKMWRQNKPDGCEDEL